ncbi:M3 family metallopeptidase [Alkalisalibacterium limincola]|uniref:Dipeptidyl carboxypeptidase n=1 Tax=Alkalisalibacterium limincola TaxID=2699169 RepID=A0A5C8KRR5_9GAMM|nr:M3 family metallopeptidase [Alkalisalibacterium limincola]TXK62655.1 M3 family metallopeptidase [Alkalisalibacterium limincola]
MKKPLALALAAALGLPLAACSPGNDAGSDPAASADAPAQSLAGRTTDGSVVDDERAGEAASENPFFQPSTLQYEFPRFDLIADEHYSPAFERGMAEHREEIEAIARNPEAASFENTIVAMERAGALLGRVSRVFFNLAGAHINDAMREVQGDMAPKLSAHSDAILLNRALFERVDGLYQQRGELDLDAESLRLLERYHTDFVRAGARLDDAQQDRLREMNSRLATLQTTFTQNVQREVNASAVFFDSREDLAGLSDAEIRAAADAAAEDGQEGRFKIALMNTTGQPPLTNMTNREARQKVFEASIERGAKGGDYDNREIVAEMVRLRAERAQLLGYEDHAHFVLEEATAGTKDAVNDMLGRLGPAAVANARREAAELQRVIDAEGGDFELAGWDWQHYAEKVRQEKYDFDESVLRPYFELDSVLVNGVFHAATELFGITFRERPDLPTYHPDVRVWEVFDHDGESLALFVGDFYARSSKRGGAWMNAYVPQSNLLETRPVVGNHQNIPKPPDGEPTLMTFDEVTTMFHEFGHAVHGMFSDVRYPRFAGTSVPRDFVEYPSQVFEMWATWPSVLANYAKHHETGEQIPQELIDRVEAASAFNEGYRSTEYLAASILDQAFHQLGPDETPSDVIAFEKQALEESGMDFGPIPPRYRTTYFSHTFSGGYSAGYYSYIWSEVLDADSVEWFRESGGLTRENGDHFRDTLLSRGGTKDAMELYQDFTGREPRLEPLLIRRGFTDDGGASEVGRDPEPTTPGTPPQGGSQR